MKSKNTNQVDDVVIRGQLMVDAHVAQVGSVDVTDTTDVDAEEDAVLLSTAGDRQPLDLSLHFVDKMIQLITAIVHYILCCIRCSWLN